MYHSWVQPLLSPVLTYMVDHLRVFTTNHNLCLLIVMPVHNLRVALDPQGSHDPDTTKTRARAASTKVNVRIVHAAPTANSHHTLNRCFVRIYGLSRNPHFGNIPGSTNHNIVDSRRNFDHTTGSVHNFDSDHNADSRHIRVIIGHDCRITRHVNHYFDWYRPSHQAPLFYIISD